MNAGSIGMGMIRQERLLVCLLKRWSWDRLLILNIFINELVTKGGSVQMKLADDGAYLLWRKVEVRYRKLCLTLRTKETEMG